MLRAGKGMEEGGGGKEMGNSLGGRGSLNKRAGNFLFSRMERVDHFGITRRTKTYIFFNYMSMNTIIPVNGVIARIFRNNWNGDKQLSYFALMFFQYHRLGIKTQRRIVPLTRLGSLKTL